MDELTKMQWKVDKVVEINNGLIDRVDELQGQVLKLAKLLHSCAERQEKMLDMIDDSEDTITYTDWGSELNN